ncbi:MAG TPA: DNA repair protein RecN, partial [Cyclobacteriaceae bacterium]|nr:DNA repair protein RecN [Cyclobacteriaceae bacterium]
HELVALFLRAFLVIALVMLKRLYIQNYALIRHLEISPSGRLNIITGETGSGKSIMIGAVGLLLGNRADTKILYDSSEKCIIEGTFFIRNYKLKDFFSSNNVDYSDETIIRREIAPGGKSRAFVNDTPVTLDIMRELGSGLMEIHSQNDTLRLGSNDFQLYLIDAFARNDEAVSVYASSYRKYQASLKELNELRQEAEQIRRDADYNNFLYDELSKASLDPGEQQSLEEELSTLEHAGEIKSRLLESTDALHNREQSVIGSLMAVHKSLEQISSFAHHLAELRDRINNSLVELKDAAREIEMQAEHVEADPDRLALVTERLNLIYRLQQKHHVKTVEELIGICDGLEQKVRQNLNLDERLSGLEGETGKLFNEALAAGKELSSKRVACFRDFISNLETMLRDLGIPDARLMIDHHESALGLNGIDEIVLRFSANKGISPKPFKEVASGGEFSRLMFCIKYLIARSTALPTLVLDEIDTGISGEIAMKMARMMKAMSAHHQVIAITHLPQIASAGMEHYYVYKDNTDKKSVSRITKLQEEDRILEIAKMLGGDSPSDTALNNARELLVKNN